jgi:hypothetical protein
MALFLYYYLIKDVFGFLGIPFWAQYLLTGVEAVEECIIIPL